MKDKEKQIPKFSFSVIDNKTKKYPDIYNIALKEDWAKGLMYCDMEGFAINEDGNLVLLDECGGVAYCPKDRFTIVFEDSVVLSREEYKQLLDNAIRVDFEYLETELAKERKETAEKIFSKLQEILNNVDIIIDCGTYAKLKGYDKEEVDICLKELAKQFGVEIKE